MNISDEYIRESYEINPTLNDFFFKKEWEKKRHIQPNVYSEEYYGKLNDLDKKYIKILKEKDKLTFEDRLLLDDLEYNVHLEEDYEIYMYMPIDSTDNILTQYVTEANGGGNFIFKDKNDYSIFLKRLKSLDSITDEILVKMKNGIKDKVTLPKQIVNKMIYDIEIILKMELYKKKKVLISREKWDKEVDKYLVKNLNRLHTFLINEYYKHTDKKIGLQKYKGGKKLYSKLVKYNTFRSLTPEKIHDYGIKQVKILKKEKERLEKLYKNRKYFKNEKEIIDELTKIRSKIIKEVHDKNFHGEITNKDLYDIKSTPKENRHGLAYYIPPDLKNNKKGTFYIDTSKPHKISKDELYVLSLHEGIPGHHYQLNHVINKSELSDYRKINSYDSYSEGWGLYCENLGKYDKVGEYYHKINYDMLRCVRLVIDTGIHHYGWSYSKCRYYIKEHVGGDDDFIDDQILRYINNPSQALTYKIGEKLFIYLRNRYLKKNGSLKDYHKIIMDIGPVNLDILLEHFTKNNLI